MPPSSWAVHIFLRTLKEPTYRLRTQGLHLGGKNNERFLLCCSDCSYIFLLLGAPTSSWTSMDPTHPVLCLTPASPCTFPRCFLACLPDATWGGGGASAQMTPGFRWEPVGPRIYAQIGLGGWCSRTLTALHSPLPLSPALWCKTESNFPSSSRKDARAWPFKTFPEIAGKSSIYESGRWSRSSGMAPPRSPAPPISGLQR